MQVLDSKFYHNSFLEKCQNACSTSSIKGLKCDKNI